MRATISTSRNMAILLFSGCERPHDRQINRLMMSSIQSTVPNNRMALCDSIRLVLHQLKRKKKSESEGSSMNKTPRHSCLT